MTRIAIDAMGGDHAPHEIVAGAVWAASALTCSKVTSYDVPFTLTIYFFIVITMLLSCKSYLSLVFSVDLS